MRALYENLMLLDYEELKALSLALDADIEELHDETVYRMAKAGPLERYRFFRTFYLSQIRYWRGAIRLVDRDDRPALQDDLRECQKQLVILRSVRYVGQPIGRA